MAVTVKIAEYKAVKNPEILKTYGLGSCVAVILYDPIKKVGGLSHFMLPSSKAWNSKRKKPGKFVDTSVKNLLLEMEKLGASKHRITAKLVGGASMFKNLIEPDTLSMGQRNIEAAKKTLNEHKIKILSEDVGEDYGRSVSFDTETGDVLIHSIYAKEKKI